MTGDIDDLRRRLEAAEQERDEHWRSFCAVGETLVKAEAERDAALAQVAALREALLKLSNEAHGFLSMADTATHGVTNIRVLELRIAEARSALATTEPRPASGETYRGPPTAGAAVATGSESTDAPSPASGQQACATCGGKGWLFRIVGRRRVRGPDCPTCRKEGA